MDRQAWIVITVCVIGLVTVMVYNTQHMPRPVPAFASPTPAAAPDQSPGAASPVPSVSPSPAIPTATPTASVAPFAEKTETLRNQDIELRLTNRGGAISEVVLLKHLGDGGNQVVLNSTDHTPIGAIIEEPGMPEMPEYTSTQGENGSVQFDRKTPEGVSIRKRFFFPPTSEKEDNFVAEMAVDFRNDGTQTYTKAGYFVSLGWTRSLHARDMPSNTRLVWCIDGKTKEKNVAEFAGSNGFIGLGQRAPTSLFQQSVANAEWVALSNQFFATLIVPLTTKANAVWGRRTETALSPTENRVGIEGAFGMPGFELQPGQTTSARFQMWVGPKLYHRLAKLDHDEAEIMNFGMWKLVSQFLLNFMNFIHGWVRNYGLAIIILTACVKGVLWPLQNKANKSMRKMSALAPKMQELKEKYKDDPTRMNQELMKLYKVHGVNPVGGCLPMMIQIPIFFGLFTMLGQVAELRNASFLWVRDLSQPDTIFTVPLPVIHMGLFTLGPIPINILPILMGATNLWLMQLTPKTGDSTQQRVMMFMPLIFLFFCYNFAAALALYYTTQNLFTILQLYQNRRQPLPVLEKVAPAGKKSRKGRS